MFKLSKKIAFPLIAVLLIGTGVGGYFLFRNFQIPKYFVDKYPELLEYCDVVENGNGLKVSCKALMLDLKPNDGSPSLTSLVISNDEELKEYTVTEEEEVFSFTNDILQFKKLKPVIINIQYTKGNLLKYSLSSITFEDIPDTYIQDIVNRDIEEIMGMDRSSTTILNSFDFCPRPETLPDYVIKKEEYAKYWEENILPKEEYLNGFNYNLDDTTIRLLFACDSAKNVGYTNICNNKIALLENISGGKSTNLTTSINWDTNFNEEGTLKEISLIYDNMYLKERYVNLSGENILENLVERINETTASEKISCSIYKIFENTGNFEEKNYIKENVLENLVKSDFALCDTVFGNRDVDKTGIYLKYNSDSDSNLYIFDKCNNLTNYLK